MRVIGLVVDEVEHGRHHEADDMDDQDQSCRAPTRLCGVETHARRR